jgi:RNA polymerase III transcription factor (TF)IIIC subunit HTH domain
VQQVLGGASDRLPSALQGLWGLGAAEQDSALLWLLWDCPAERLASALPATALPTPAASLPFLLPDVIAVSPADAAALLPPSFAAAAPDAYDPAVARTVRTYGPAKGVGGGEGSKVGGEGSKGGGEGSKGVAGDGSKGALGGDVSSTAPSQSSTSPLDARLTAALGRYVPTPGVAAPQPAAEALRAEFPLTSGPEAERLDALVRELFERRPVWMQTTLTAIFTAPDRVRLRRLVAPHAYYVSRGPYRACFVRRGLNPADGLPAPWAGLEHLLQVGGTRPFGRSYAGPAGPLGSADIEAGVPQLAAVQFDELLATPCDPHDAGEFWEVPRAGRPPIYVLRAEVRRPDRAERREKISVRLPAVGALPLTQHPMMQLVDLFEIAFEASSAAPRAADPDHWPWSGFPRPAPRDLDHFAPLLRPDAFATRVVLSTLLDPLLPLHLARTFDALGARRGDRFSHASGWLVDQVSFLNGVLRKHTEAAHDAIVAKKM